jgi:SAM-dependent methyltransferase
MVALRLQSRPCPICGPDRPGRVFAEANVELNSLDGFAFASRKLPEYMHWRLVECTECDLLYADPAPNAADLAAAYDAASFDSSNEARLASHTYARFLPEIAARLPDLDGALDIGTGDGSFLELLLKHGFKGVAGVEPSAAPIAAAAELVRPLIRHDVFRPELFEPASFSFISCFQTIEHLPNPLALCRDAWQLLKPGGVLFLIGHNRRALSARILGTKSPIFDLEHMQLFSRESLRRLLSTAGFTGVMTRSIWNRYPLHYWGRLFPLPAGLKSKFVAAAKATVPRLLIPLPAGNLAAFAFKPR